MSRIAYVMSRFPKITETFVLYEMKALEELGAHVEVFPLLRQPPGPRHPEAAAYEGRAHFLPFMSNDVFWANVRRFVVEPRLYVRTWWDALRGAFGSLNFFLGALLYFPKCVVMAERMRALGIEHIHAHFANHPAMAAMVVHRLTGIPYSFTAHGSDLHVERRMLPAKVEAADFVVAVSEYNRELIVEECGEQVREKVRVIHCGTDPTAFKGVDELASLDRRLTNGGAPHAPFRVACIASLEEVKGHRYLLQACRLLVNRGIDVQCQLAGDGPLRSELEALVTDLGIEANVRFRGAVSRPEVGDILSSSDVAVLPSYPTPSGKREGIPVALMEAMMSGLPVVASGVSGIPELVEHERTGFLVPPGDPWALAERLKCLAGAPHVRRKFGRAGREKVLREFDLRVGAGLLLGAIQGP